ncbi:hypothetical protein JCM11641_007496 [Rhodosporidiobolus odoratus]
MSLPSHHRRRAPLQPLPSYQSFISASHTTTTTPYESANSSLRSFHDPSLLSALESPVSPSTETPTWEETATASRPDEHTGQRGILATGVPRMGEVVDSFSTFPSSTRTRVDRKLPMSPADPLPCSPLVSSPLPQPPARPVIANKENVSSPIRSRPPPFPRPNSPLPPLPPTAIQQARSSSKLPSSPSIPMPLTSLSSLAAFKAHHQMQSPAGTSSDDTHRTSSDVDLDFSFDAHQETQLVVGEDAAEEAVYSEESVDMSYRSSTSDWVGIDMRPAEHDVPEAHLVRSSSGQLVGARHPRAASAIDLRAQFKAGELAGGPAAQAAAPADFAIDVGGLVDEGEEQHRREVREGKRPIEGARAVDTALWMQAGGPLAVEQPQPPQAIYRRSVGRGFAYNPTDSLAVPPRSAPAYYVATFAEQQQHQHSSGERWHEQLDQAKRSKAFPLPLRLLDRTKRTANAIVSPALIAAASFGALRGAKGSKGSAVDSDAESTGPSPLFDSDFDDTVRTAPSTPNDTPLFQECFDDNELAPPVPVPHRLGSSANPPAPLAGLGVSFGEGTTFEDFPVIPLRQSRRISLPPKEGTRRCSLRHAPIPSLAIFPPPVERSSHDSAETDSSAAISQDSAIDPTASPSRRLSRRVSLTTGAQFTQRRHSSIHFHRRGPSSTAETPNRVGGPSVKTPDHLLVTPTPKKGLSPSFSFSPAPLRLVKAQLLRAAGYEVGPKPATSPPPYPLQQQERGTDSRPASVDAVSSNRSRRRPAVFDDLAYVMSSSPAAWLDEVVPAKLAFIAGFILGPWCFIIGGWLMRNLDGELKGTRGQRCRDPECGCGRFLRGSALRDHSAESSALSRAKASKLNPQELGMWAGLDRWVFLNRVAAGGAGAGLTVVVAVAIWAAAMG